MKLVILGAVAGGLLALAAPATAAEYSVINLDATVDRPIDQVWAKVGGYCQIADWLKRLAPCVLTGDGGVGSIRAIGPQGSIIEIMVAKTKYSYTYTQPDTKILYHGTLWAEPIDAAHTKLLYALIYDQAPDGTAEAKAKDRQGRTNNFTAALATMKALAEGQ